MSQFEEPEQPHRSLNPLLWDHEDLQKPVQIALLKIARAYWEFLKIDTPIVDIVVSGSQANYNYSSHSDIDLHLIVSYDQVQCDMAVDELFDTKRLLWKAQHDINIHDIPVEVYVEDTAHPAVSAAYSILTNKWITPPQRDPRKPDVKRIKQLCHSWVTAITHAVRSGDLEQITQTKDLLWAYRKVGLAREGEMGTPNLVFKTLRNSGVTEQLLRAVSHLRDEELSLEDQN